MSESELPGVRVLRDQMVSMRDGVRLATDVYLPVDAIGALPVLLERTPYGKTGTNHADCSLAEPMPRAKPLVAEAFVRRGYAYVLQDCRGRYGSEGGFSKYLNEAADGVDTLAWIRTQPWCNGDVGTLGLSYGAHVQTALAGEHPPGLKAMWLDSGGFSSAYHSGIRQGGAYELKQLTWAMKHALLAPETAADPERRQSLLAEQARLGQWARVNPWLRGDSPLTAAPEYEAYIVDQWAHECFDDYWCQSGLYARGRYRQFPDVPMVHLSSWYDPYALTAAENYCGLRQGRRSPAKLVLGPWTHGQRSKTYAGDVDFGPAATLDQNLAPDYQRLREDWFDAHLRDGVGRYLPESVHYFLMGGGSGLKNASGRMDHGGCWKAAADWPPPESVETAFYLHPQGELHARPYAGEASLGYRFDPTDPVPTIGGATASGAPLMVAGAFDQRESEGLYGARQPGRALADRDDVLVFQTAPLAQAVDVVGPIQATLWVSTSALDTDFTIKLIDLYPPNADYPHGYAMNLSHGILRLRFRNGFERAELAEPGQVYPITISAFPTANRFAAGHRIRLDISSSNFPHFDVNPNSGAPAGERSDPVLAKNRVHLSADCRSALRLHCLS